MRSLSSIFSFSALRGLPKPTGSFWVAVALLAAARVALTQTGPAMIRATDGWIKRDFGNFFRVAARPHPGNRPSIFATGSSRLGLGLHQDTLAGLARVSVGKAALSASSPWEILKLLEIREDLLGGFDVLLFDLQAYQFNDNCPTRFRRGNNFVTFSNWRERSELYGTSPLVEALKDLWPVHRERMSFEDAVNIMETVESERRQFRPMDARWQAFRTSRRMRERYKGEYFQPGTVAERHMKDFEYSTFMESAVRRLIELCRAKGVRVVIVIPPATREFVRILRERYPDGYSRIISFAESLEADDVGVFIAETPADIGAAERNFFMDYGHMTEDGAAAYTRWLIIRMKQSGTI